MGRIRNAIRKILIALLEMLREKEKKPREMKKRWWQKEINVPAPLLLTFIFIALFLILLEHFGLIGTNFIGILIFNIFLFSLFSIYFRKYATFLLSSIDNLLLLGLFIIFFAIIMKMVQVMSPELSSYIVPIASASMLLNITIGPHMAGVSVLSLSLLIALFNGFSFNLFFVSLAGGFTSIVTTMDVRHRKDLTRAGLYVAGANILSIASLGLLQQQPLRITIENCGWGIGNGIICAVLAIGILPFVESAFGLITNIRLLELSDLQQPLLKRLMMESPGTYHHSLLVSNMAETAAGLIGANSLLAQVGALYHDIGKLTKPEYFFENQGSLVSRHDDLTPDMSSLIVLSHAKEGVALAKEYGLSKSLVDFIRQHHGTSIIHFFYKKALEQAEPRTKVEEEKYRYPGPKPQSREIAIVMLADAVEGAARAGLENPTYSQIKDLVDKIINNKFIDGQLSDCNITLYNLHRIAESFVHSLTGIYHGRIEYPKEEEEEEKL